MSRKSVGIDPCLHIRPSHSSPHLYHRLVGNSPPPNPLGLRLQCTYHLSTCRRRSARDCAGHMPISWSQMKDQGWSCPLQSSQVRRSPRQSATSCRGGKLGPALCCLGRLHLPSRPWQCKGSLCQGQIGADHHYDWCLYGLWFPIQFRWGSLRRGLRS